MGGDRRCLLHNNAQIVPRLTQRTLGDCKFTRVWLGKMIVLLNGRLLLHWLTCKARSSVLSHTSHRCVQVRLSHSLSGSFGSSPGPHPCHFLLLRLLPPWSYVRSEDHALLVNISYRESDEALSGEGFDDCVRQRHRSAGKPRQNLLRKCSLTKGVGPVLTNWCWVPAGTTIRSPAFISWSLPFIVAFPTPDVKVKAWSTVCT